MRNKACVSGMVSGRFVNKQMSEISNTASYRNYLVAFIDILGQKEAFQGLDEYSEQSKSDFAKRLAKAHSETVEFVEQFRGNFESFFNAYMEEGESRLTVPEDKKEQFDAMRKVVLKHQRFSDCIQVFVPLEGTKYHANAINGVFGLLVACGSMLLLSLVQRKAIRAGLEVGLGTELNNGEVYGPALFKAYHLETEIAQYPRIILGNELINYLMNLSNKNPQIPDQTMEDIELCSVLASSCLKMVIQDTDGQPVLDYLGEEFQRNIRASERTTEKPSFDEMSSHAYNFVETEFQRWRKLKNGKLAIRYHLLRSYFRARKT